MGQKLPMHHLDNHSHDGFVGLGGKRDRILRKIHPTGRLKYRNMTDEESAVRVNYQTADNINYKDGDLKSTIDKAAWSNGAEDETKEDIGSERMYHNKNTEDNPMSSLVNDRVRVYKGSG